MVVRHSCMAGLVCAGLLLTHWGTASGHVGTAVYPIYELPTADLPDLYDGSLGDWEDALPGTSLTQDDFAPLAVEDGAGINPADLAYRMYMAWNSANQRIYVCIERVDDVYVNTYQGGDPTMMWQHDGAEIMLDGDHSGGDYNGFDPDIFGQEQVKLLTGYQAQQYVVVPQSPDGVLIGTIASASGWAGSPPWAQAGGSVTGQAPTTFVVEAAMTAWDELNWEGPDLSRRSVLVAGKIIGFQISIPDWDYTTEDLRFRYHAFHTLSGMPNTWRMADNFVDGELVGCTGGDCGSLPVEVWVVAPNGGEHWKTGRTYTLRWYADPSTEFVRLEYSPDNGSTWEVIAAETANDGAYDWQAPTAPAPQALVRVSDAGDGQPVDTSNGPFAVSVPTVDFSADGEVNFDDFFLFADRFGTADPDVDVDVDGVVGNEDYFIFADNFGRTAAQIVIPDPPGPGPGPFGNAQASFQLQPSGSYEVGPSQDIQLTVSGSGLVDVRQAEVVLEVSPPWAFDLQAITVSPPASGWFGLAPEVFGGTMRVAFAALGGGPLSGDAPFAVVTLRTAGDLAPGTAATIRVVEVSVGPSSTERDVFGATDLNLELALNASFHGVSLTRRCAFPGEPVQIGAHFAEDADPISVQAEVRVLGASEPLDTVALADDGVPPDNVADDELYVGEWAGATQAGEYTVDLLVTYPDGTRRLPAVGTIPLAHTILTLPNYVMISPEQRTARLPVFLEDDGDGYLNLGFYSAQFAIDVWQDGGGLPERPVFQGMGAVLEGQTYMLDTAVVADADAWGTPNWRVSVSLASATPLEASPAPGRIQAPFAYVGLGLPEIPRLDNALGLAAPHALFNEDEGAVATACCDGGLSVGRGDVDTSRTIESFDASLVLMHTVRRINLNDPSDARNGPLQESYGFTLPQFAAQAADVSAQMGITAFDASLILRRELAYITHFPSEEGYYRLWDLPEGWWNPPLEPAARPVAAPGPRLRRTVWLGAAEEDAGTGLAVAVHIDEVDGILAGTFALSFDARSLQSAGIRASSATADYLFADHAEGGTVRVSFAGARSGKGPGLLAHVLFRSLPPALQGTRVTDLALGEVQLNEGEVAVRVEAAAPVSSVALPASLALFPGYPNPFNPSTAIRYTLTREGPVRLSIYDLAGQRIRSLVDATEGPGLQQATWDARDDAGQDVATGVYLCRLDTAEGVRVQKMLLVR
ncbi:MAG: T9SS type A sorting domain-containing protein [Candidatus Latescibacterota bacterium]